MSVDLGQRVVSAVSEGACCHQAAARFGVSVSRASRWSEQFRQEGQFAPKPSGGDHASHRIEAQAHLILTTDEARPAILPRRVA
ncbi:UNVERIFIED_ORG: transposase [Methylorubrum zatmanii]